MTRTLQIAVFVLGVLSLLGAVPFISGVVENALCRAGVALFLTDIVLILLWPVPRRPIGESVNG
jgi:hypothetical protein